VKIFIRSLISIAILILYFENICLVLAQESIQTIIKKIQPSTVVILIYDNRGKSLGLGSGFFINSNGEIITNYHVISGASRVDIKTADGKIYPIKQVLAEDRVGDLIRISIAVPRNSVRALSIAPEVPEVGERIFVIGNPLGLEQTVSDGIVSAVRDIPSLGKIIQITAPISSGSSGSPVVNTKGEVIGIASFQIVEGQNLNFAIPSDRISELKMFRIKSLTEWNAEREKVVIVSAEESFETGFAFILKGEYKKAAPYFEDAVKKSPNFAEAYFMLGLSYTNLERHIEAIEAYKQGISLKPDFAHAYFMMGLSYFLLRLYDEAIGANKQGILIKPDYAPAYYILGSAYFFLGRWNEAIIACKQAIRIKPDYAEAYNRIGITYSRLELYYEAIESYKHGIRIKPNYAEAHYNLGYAYSALGRYTEAIEAHKQAIRINPDYAEAHFMLGMAYFLLERYQEAIDAYKQAIRLKPSDANTHFALGLTYIAIGDKSSALEEYKILKELNKDLANQLFNYIYK